MGGFGCRRKKNGRLSAVVVRFSRARKRYEREGILVEEEALERAEQECLADEESRARRRDGDAARRAGGDLELQARMAAEIGKLFPAARPGGPRRSPDTPRSAAAAGWDAPRPDEHSTPKRSSWRYWHRSATKTRIRRAADVRS